MLYTGLDFHKSFSYITTVNDQGDILGQKKLPSNGEIVEFLKEFGESMEVAIEATPSWYWLYDSLEDEGFKVRLSHPLKTKAIAYAKVKTDKVDSAACFGSSFEQTRVHNMVPLPSWPNPYEV